MLEKWGNCDMSAAVRAMFKKLGTMMQFDPLDRSDCDKFEMSKSKHDGGRHLEKNKSSHMWASVRHI